MILFHNVFARAEKSWLTKKIILGLLVKKFWACENERDRHLPYPLQ